MVSSLLVKLWRQIRDHYQSVVTLTVPVQSPLYLATRRLLLYPAMTDFLSRSEFFIIILPPELESEVDDGSRSFDDLEFLE